MILQMRTRQIGQMAASHHGEPPGQAPIELVLPSWQDGPARHAILSFLARTTTAGSPEFVDPRGRTAVFDNDGTLWSEQPLMPELAFALDRLHELAPQHPSWAGEEPFASALRGDLQAVITGGGVAALVELAVAARVGTTPEQFRRHVSSWLRGSHHPTLGRPFDTLLYVPMLEVLELFAAHDFQCFVVSAGGLEFLRAWTSTRYNLPSNQVIGSTLDLRYVVENGRADVVQTSDVTSFTDGPRKVAAIATIIGQRPLAAFGNADGDYEMLQYVTSGPGPGLGMIIHHDDADREYAYDRGATFGHLDRALEDASAQGWIVVSMREDWKSIYASAADTE